MYRITWIVLLALLLTPFLATPAAAAAAHQPDKPDLTITAETSGVLLDLNLPSYRIEEVTHEGATYQQISIAGEGWWPGGQPGAPSLPERGLMLAVPPTGEVTVQVLDARRQTLDGAYRLAPKPTGVLIEDADGGRVVEQWLPDPAAYAAESIGQAGQAEITQEGWFRGYRFVRLSLRPFHYDPASGQVQVATAMQVRVNFVAAAPPAPAAADPLFAPIFQASFANFTQAAGWQTRPAPDAPPADAAQRTRSADPWIKVTVKTDGLYRVTYTDLQNAGVALSGLNPRTFRLLDAGQEQHIRVLGEDDNVFDATDSILFYGLRNTAPHSDDNNVYWLTWGGANGLRMAVQDAAPAGASLAPGLLTTAHAEINNEYKQQRPYVEWLQPVLYDHWYSGQVGQTTVPTTSVTFPGLQVDTSSAVAPSLAVWMAGEKEVRASYTVSFTLNSGPPSTRTWTNTRVLDGVVALPAGALVNGANRVVVQPINVFGVTNNDFTVWLDWLRLTYPYNGQYLADASFSNPTSGQWRYQIGGVPSATPWVLNVATAGQPKLLSNAAVAGSGPYTIEWQATTTAADRFLVVPEAAVRQPAAVALWQGSTLLDANQQVDYLMIAHPTLLAAAQPLAAMHTANGLSVRLVNVQEIYDLFSDGSVSAAAIRSYLAYAYSAYQAPAPTYVLLIGDGSVNSRGYTAIGVINQRFNWIPPFYGGFDYWSGSSVSDNGFVRVQGDDLLGEMIISRLPVNSASETTTVVNKIIQYPLTFPQSRKLNTLWVSDNPDFDNPGSGTQFHMATEETLAPMQAQFQADRVYFCVPGTNVCPPDPWIYTDIAAAQAAVINTWNQGHVLLHFTGHGSFTTWAHERLFRSSWANMCVPGTSTCLNNGPALPFLLVSSCTNGYFVSERFDGLDETLLRASGKGTMGGFTGVTFDTLPPQTHLLTNFVEAVMQEGITQPGAAATVARARTFAELTAPDNERSAVGHSLTGDPALPLIAPNACAEGDVNCDDIINIVDVQLVAGAWNAVAWTSPYNPRYDVVRDGHIDVNDIAAVVNLWHTPLP
jgi:hypothetical protein